MNNTCPICGQKTSGKGVRGVNFCATHRELAIYLRDRPEYQKHEVGLGKNLRGQDFATVMKSFVSDANTLLAKQGLKVIGT